MSRLFCLAVLLSLALSGLAQKKKEDPAAFAARQILKEQSVLLQTDEEALRREAELTIPFPNVNVLPLYSDKKTLDQIFALNREMNLRGPGDAGFDRALRELDPLLTGYVQQFGIRNFRDQNALLWMLGGVREHQGDTARALFFFELAQTHRYTFDSVQMRYIDSLRAPTRSEWLPIEQYYELLELRRSIDTLKPQSVLLSMGTKINSDDADYAPFVHPSDSVLIFTSRRDTSGIRAADYVDPFSRPNEDLYYTEIDFVTGEWRYARRFSDSVNSRFNEGSACLSPDGKTLYFTRCQDTRGYGDCDIYTAQYNPATGGWSHIQNLGRAINSEYWDSQPNLSSDGKTLFFTSNRKDGFGDTDIYYSVLDESGRWSPARNMGPMVNTPQSEVTPFFLKINQTLYFSSTGHLTNFGGYDIFKVNWLGDRWGRPRNVGPLVNTPGNQYYFAISGKGTTIFYANSRDPEKDHIRQNFDLFSFPMPMEARPDAIAKLRGTLRDSITGHVLQGTILVVDLEEGVEIAPKSISETGYFEFDLINDRRYRITVLGNNFLTIQNDLILKGDTTFNVFVESFEQRKPLVFESLEFKSNSAKLSATLKPKLDYIVRFMKAYPQFKLVVEGHTDSDGSAENNKSLSQARANAIASYLKQKGEFKGDRFTAIGYGEEMPLVPNDTEENKRKNRRVAFKLVLDESYSGEFWLPTEEELSFADSLESLPDPKFDKEFEWDPGEREAWESELDLDEELDLEKELEEDILAKYKPGETEPADGESPLPAPKPAPGTPAKPVPPAKPGTSAPKPAPSGSGGKP